MDGAEKDERNGMEAVLRSRRLPWAASCFDPLLTRTGDLIVRPPGHISVLMNIPPYPTFKGKPYHEVVQRHRVLTRRQRRLMSKSKEQGWRPLHYYNLEM